MSENFCPKIKCPKIKHPKILEINVLFLDVVRFYGIDNVSGLRYDSGSKNTLLFWIYGQWLMHGKFTRFMTGGKFTGAATCGKIRPGNFPQGGTSINFAVPSNATIKRESKELVVLPSHLEPGFLPGLVDQFTKEMKSVYVEKLDDNIPPLLRVSTTIKIITHHY